jgi:stage III sporulation protein AB
MVYGEDEFMIMKWIGAALVIAGCGGIGFAICRNYRREEDALMQLIHSFEWMQCELNYRMTPLPALCRAVSEVAKGFVGEFYRKLATELDEQITPDVFTCVQSAIRDVPQLPASAIRVLRNLGTSLGMFDLQGQVGALETAEELCKKDLRELSNNKQEKLRNYQVLGICAGVTMVVLFI